VCRSSTRPTARRGPRSVCISHHHRPANRQMLQQFPSHCVFRSTEPDRRANAAKRTFHAAAGSTHHGGLGGDATRPPREGARRHAAGPVLGPPVRSAPRPTRMPNQRGGRWLSNCANPRGRDHLSGDAADTSRRVAADDVRVPRAPRPRSPLTAFVVLLDTTYPIAKPPPLLRQKCSPGSPVANIQVP
jgi:hypothetical protein